MNMVAINQHGGDSDVGWPHWPAEVLERVSPVSPTLLAWAEKSCSSKDKARWITGDAGDDELRLRGAVGAATRGGGGAETGRVCAPAAVGGGSCPRVF
jgi:hypothetical protein